MFILRDLMNGPKRFGELLKTAEGVSHKVLAENLRGMESDGLIARKAVENNASFYTLTELGQTMRPILREPENWDARFMAENKQARKIPRDKWRESVERSETSNFPLDLSRFRKLRQSVRKDQFRLPQEQRRNFSQNSANFRIG